MIKLSKGQRELFWDDYLTDAEKTTAFARLIQPTLKECCYVFDKENEKTSISYPQILKDDSGYKMYYVVHSQGGVELSVIESQDGLTWERPCLQPQQSNVLMKIPDNMFVFYDENPNCPKNEKYKAIGSFERKDKPGSGELRCLFSADGYKFNDGRRITTDGHFDTLNTIIRQNGKYYIYFRGMHDENGNNIEKWDNSKIRDIRMICSDDFVNWSTPKRISFTDEKDYPLYTNNVSIYPRAPHMLIGFPVRYCERKNWTENETQLKSSAVKKLSVEKYEKRAGLTVTDCIFMCSRNGETWRKYNEAFMTPGYEHPHNWVYGDCYPAYDLIDSGKETYYMYTCDYHRSEGVAKPLNRYEIRKDGFACRMADGEERVLITKPFTFEGTDLHINFSTSAYGYIFADVLDENGAPLSQKESFEIYGDTTDRKITFADGEDFSKYAGKTVRLRFRMRDAKLFSLIFE